MHCDDVLEFWRNQMGDLTTPSYTLKTPYTETDYKYSCANVWLI